MSKTPVANNHLTERARALTVLTATFLTLCALPAAAVALSGLPVERYLEFPPRSLYIAAAPFSQPVFLGLALILLMVLLPPAVILARRFTFMRPAASFPLWGYAGLLLLLAAWLLAWSRFEFFSVLQPHTFFPLWLGYILVLNALCVLWNGSCPLYRTAASLAVFLLSSVFWWSFEYLNRFVQNWSYQNVSQFQPFEYFCYATLSFSTVLPAVWATKEWLCALGAGQPFAGELKFRAEMRPAVSYAALLAGALGLLLLPLFPQQLYPTVWLTPILILVAFAQSCGLAGITTRADLVCWALAGLFCGFFWELWNSCSYARWIYHISYVQWAHLFEMPLAGYAGYLPFGVFCGLVVGLFLYVFPEKKDA